MTKLIAECLSNAKIFRREEEVHLPPTAATRPLEIPDERVAVQAIVERVVEEVGEAVPQVRIRWEGTFGDAEGDEGLLRQALLNLARNAAEACTLTAGGGQVTVRGEIVHGEE